MTDAIKPRRVVAIHEAGHAVMAAMMGAPLVRVTISDDGAGLGADALGRNLRGITDHGPGPHPGKVRALEGMLDMRDALVGAAGLAAESIETGQESRMGLGDPDFFAAFIAPLAVSPAGVSDSAAAAGLHFAHTFSGLAGDILRRRWETVQAVATALLEKGSITGDEVRRMVGMPGPTALDLARPRLGASAQGGSL